MVDAHCHVLPGLDDGPADMEGSLALARHAAREGIATIVATPHIRDDHPFSLDLIPVRVAEVNAELSREGVPVEVVPGAEVALSRLDALDDETLRQLTIGNGPYILVETPYSFVGDLLESHVFDLQVRGFLPVLAHPERSPCFLGALKRLSSLVERGIMCSVTAASMEGRFGRTVRSFALELFRAQLVHNVASDAHDAERRPPELRAGFASLDQDLRGLMTQAGWFTQDAASAMLAGDPLPPRPQGLGRRRLRSFRRVMTPGSGGAGGRGGAA